jgi:hypothetical protein
LLRDVVRREPNVLEEDIASIFMVKKEKSIKLPAEVGGNI